MNKNKPEHQPRYPCPDAPPELLMNREHFIDEDILVYWSDTKETDYFQSPDLFNADYADPIIYGKPTTFPKKSSITRIPRSVRLITPNPAFADDLPVGSGIPIFIGYATAVRDAIRELQADIYFQWAPRVPDPNPWKPALIAGEYNFEFLDPDFLDTETNCFFTSETLTFIIGDFGCDPWGTFDNITDPDVFTLIGPSSTWDDFLAYATLQYDFFNRYKTIVQLYPHAPYLFEKPPVPDPDLSEQLNDDVFNAIFGETDDFSTPPGFEQGPDFSYDIDYIVETVRTYWSL